MTSHRRQSDVISTPCTCLVFFVPQFCQANKGRRAEEYSNITISTDDLNIGDSEDAINNDKVVCSECCEGDLCNSQGCGQPGNKKHDWNYSCKITCLAHWIFFL